MTSTDRLLIHWLNRYAGKWTACGIARGLVPVSNKPDAITCPRCRTHIARVPS
jgi:hypothetical protein